MGRGHDINRHPGQCGLIHRARIFLPNADIRHHRRNRWALGLMDPVVHCIQDHNRRSREACGRICQTHPAAEANVLRMVEAEEEEVVVVAAERAGQWVDHSWRNRSTDR